MRIVALTFVSAGLIQNAGCSGSGFSGSGNGNAVTSKKSANGEPTAKQTTQAKPAPEISKSTPTPAPTQAPTPTALPEVCSRTGAVSLEANVPTHQDFDAQVTNRYGDGMPSSDVAQSQVIRLDLNNIKGDVLPVSSFGLDDIAIIVKENQDLSLASKWNATTRTRNIRVPSDALMIFDGNNPEYASGSVDSGATTIYEFTNKRVTIAGGTSQSLRSVYELGAPLIAHNKIQLSELKARGFVDASNRIVFKVFHVAHGWGNVTLRFDLKPCQ
ncbi:MAG: hypothetical protein FJY29_04025 [Betaproteobacteria bacterium]|nr:hypothetical protein [Betaproteobacteria bacterium]